MLNLKASHVILDSLWLIIHSPSGIAYCFIYRTVQPPVARQQTTPILANPSVQQIKKGALKQFF